MSSPSHQTPAAPDLPLLFLGGVAALTVFQLATQIQDITWIAAGGLVVPVLCGSGLVCWGRSSPSARSQRDQTTPQALPAVAQEFSSHELTLSTPGRDTEVPTASLTDEDQETLLLGEELDGLLLEQQISRWSRPTGEESLTGELLIRFPAGARMVVVHLPWQPHLKGRPQANVDLVDGQDVEVLVDQLQTYGLRLVARRREGLEAPATCRVEFYIADTEALQAAA